MIEMQIQTEPPIATVICTMNRPHDLMLALDALADCKPAPSQVLVSDDSPLANRDIERLCQEYTIVKYAPGPRRGLSANRNSALQHVSADWIHFIDDDVLVPTDFYQRANEVLSNSAGDRIITGYEWKFTQGPDQTPQKVLPPRSQFWAHLLPASAETANCVVINATLFPRALFSSGAKFDEFLKFGCEEIDISRRARANGYRLVLTDQLSVNHYPSQVNRDSYQEVATASVIYAGLKRQWVYEQSGVKAIAFALLAIPRVWIQQLRVGGPRRLPILARQTVRGVLAFMSSCVFHRGEYQP